MILKMIGEAQGENGILRGNGMREDLDQVQAQIKREHRRGIAHVKVQCEAVTALSDLWNHMEDDAKETMIARVVCPACSGIGFLRACLLLLHSSAKAIGDLAPLAPWTPATCVFHSRL